VFRALGGGEVAAEVLDEALGRDALSAEGLRVYAGRRRQEFGAKAAVSGIVQGLLAWPPAMRYALRRLAARPGRAEVLGAVLGDYRPAREALRPSFLCGLLWP